MIREHIDLSKIERGVCANTKNAKANILYKDKVIRVVVIQTRPNTYGRFEYFPEKIVKKSLFGLFKKTYERGLHKWSLTESGVDWTWTPFDQMPIDLMVKDEKLMHKPTVIIYTAHKDPIEIYFDDESHMEKFISYFKI